MASPGFAQLGPILDPGVHFAFPGMNDARGRDAVVHAHDVLFGAFDSRAVSLLRSWRTASAQAVEWTLSGSQARPWMGVAPTNKTVAIRGLTLLWTKDDGSLTDVHAYFDVAVVKAQLGAGPKELAGVAASPAPAGTSAQVFEQNGLPEEKDNVTAARSWLDALEGGNLTAYEAAVSDDFSVVTAERPQSARGKEEARAYFKTMHKAIGQLDTTIDNDWGIGKFAIVEYDIAGEQIGPIGWVPARRNKVVRMHVVDAIEFRDRKIVNVWRYDNPQEIIEGSPGP